MSSGANVIAYRRAISEDAPRIGVFLAVQFAAQPDLLVGHNMTADQLTTAFAGILASPTSVVQIGEEGGNIVALAHGTLGERVGDTGTVKFVVCNLIIVSGWATQAQRKARLAALVLWCLNDDKTMGVQEVDTGPLKSACMGAGWMANVVKWTPEVTGEFKRYRGTANEMLTILGKTK